MGRNYQLRLFYNSQNDLLIIGSGVYAWRPVEPIQIFLKNLPRSSNVKVFFLVYFKFLNQIE